MAEESMLQEAIEAIRRRDLERARDLLTRLLKTDRDNATYWIWMSAAVDTKKERIYCLQTALNLDPENASAKRGLILLGAMPADDSVQPFPLSQIRPWENDLKVSDSKNLRGLKAVWASPLGRLLILLGAGVLLIAGLTFGYIIPRAGSLVPTRTPGPSPTYTPTVTPLYGSSRSGTPTPTFFGPTPLWMMLPEPYTPTPLYVDVDHPQISSDSYNAAMRYFDRGEYDTAIDIFEQVLAIEPNAVDIYFYIGESYRLAGEYEDALEAFEQALAIDDDFGPA